MSFSFIPEEMTDDLGALARAASPFLAPRSPERLTQLANNLRNAVANAKATGDEKFDWKTEDEAPIRIKGSRNWKGGTNNFDSMFAEIDIDYRCELLAAEGRISVTAGVTVVRIKRDVDPGNPVKVFHCDAEPGGWMERVGGRDVIRAGHPPFHTQFYGGVNDLPRLPSLFVHPLDVISLVILELHQKHWRDYVKETKPRTALRLFPGRQRARLKVIASIWAASLGDTHDHGPTILQRRMQTPLQL